MLPSDFPIHSSTILHRVPSTLHSAIRSTSSFSSLMKTSVFVLLVCVIAVAAAGHDGKDEKLAIENKFESKPIAAAAAAGQQQQFKESKEDKIVGSKPEFNEDKIIGKQEKVMEKHKEKEMEKDKENKLVNEKMVDNKEMNKEMPTSLPFAQRLEQARLSATPIAPLLPLSSLSIQQHAMLSQETARLVAAKTVHLPSLCCCST